MMYEKVMTILVKMSKKILSQNLAVFFKSNEIIKGIDN